MDEFTDYLKSIIGSDERFTINPHVIKDWGGVIETSIFLPPKKSMEIEQEYIQTIVKKGFTSFNILSYSSPESNSCFADKKNNFVVYPAESSVDGDKLNVQKCTVGLFDEQNTVGFISGNGELVLNEHMNTWVSDSPFKKNECSSCFFVLNCFGSSCPLNTIRKGYVTCPEEKYREIEIVKEIISFTSN